MSGSRPATGHSRMLRSAVPQTGLFAHRAHRHVPRVPLASPGGSCCRRASVRDVQQLAGHGRSSTIIKFDPVLRDPLGDQDARVFTPLLRRVALGVMILWKLELVGIPSLSRSHYSEHCATS